MTNSEKYLLMATYFMGGVYDNKEKYSKDDMFKAGFIYANFEYYMKLLNCCAELTSIEQADLSNLIELLDCGNLRGAFDKAVSFDYDNYVNTNTYKYMVKEQIK